MQRAAIQLCLVAVSATCRGPGCPSTPYTRPPGNTCGSGTETMVSGLPPLAKSPRRLRPRSPAPARVHGASPAKAHLQAAPALNSPSRPSSRGDIYVAGVSGRSMELEAPGPGLTCPPRRAALAPRVRSRSSPMDTASRRHRPAAVTERPRRLVTRPSTGAAGHARRIAGAVKEAGAGRAPRSRLRIDASLATALHFFAIDPVGPLILHSTMAPLIHSTPSNQFPVYRQNTHAFLPRHAKHRPPALAQESMPWPMASAARHAILIYTTNMC